MSLMPAQKRVLTGMSVGLLVSVSLVVVGMLNPFGGNTAPISALGYALLANTWMLIVAIARLARHRFTQIEDIDGGALSDDSGHAKACQAIIQNTVEQYSTALGVYVAWVLLMPDHFSHVILLCSLSFCVGRTLFFSYYFKGAAARALGFALTFYPTVIAAATILIYQLINLFG